MAINIIISIFVLILTVIFSSTFTTEASVSDFCVADTSKPTSPAGYFCKNPNNVTARDFFYSLATKGNTTMSRIDFESGSVLQMHNLPAGAEEIILMVEVGKVLVGFITSDGTVYINVLNAGDIFVGTTQTILGFQVDLGAKSAVEYASFNSAQPRIQVIDDALIGKDLQKDIIRQATGLLKKEEIQRLKRVFGGTH